MKLTIKQEKFVDAYIQCGNGSEAARQAGYSAKSSNITASKLLTKDNISAEIKRRLEKVKNESIASLSEIMQTATAIMRGEMEEEIALPINGRNGKIEVVKVPARIRDRIEAGKFLAKLQTAAESEDKTPTVIRIIRASKEKTYNS